MMHYDRGDVVLVLFPDSNLRTAKRRPALTVIDVEIDKVIGQCAVLSEVDTALRATLDL